MPTLPNLLAQLQRKGISLHLSDDRLQYRTIGGALGADDRDIIKSRREEIIRFLRAQAAAVRPPVTESRAVVPSLGQRLWWKWVTEAKDPPPQLIHIVKRFPGVDPATVEQGIRDLLIRTPMLRSRFQDRDGDLAVSLNDPGSFEITAAQASGEAQLAEKVKAFTAHDMPAGDPWLTRAVIVTLPSGDTVAVLTVNHMIFDGPSHFLLDAELDKIGQAAPPPPGLQFFDYAAWEQNWFEAHGSALVDYWFHWCRSIPTLHSRGTRQEVVWRPGHRVPTTFVIPGRIAHRIRQMAADLSTSPFLVYLTLFAIALARWSGQPHFGIRSVGDGRLQEALASVMGYMTMTDPIEIKLDPSGSFGANLKAIERDFLAALELRAPSLHAFLPYMIDARTTTDEVPNNLAMLINYHPPKPVPGAEPEAESFTWPPPLTEHESFYWTHRVPAIVLDIMDREGDDKVRGLFRLNGTLLSQGERDDLIAAFFAAISEHILAD